MKRNLTCIVCPMGCDIEVETENDKIISIKGNTCLRGADYAKSECTNPMRTITTTVKCENGEPVAVKTDGTVPKSKIFESMEIINKAVAKLPVSVGDVIIEDLFGCRVVATENKTAE